MTTRLTLRLGLLAGLAWLGASGFVGAQQPAARREIPLSTSKMLVTPVPGHPQRTNSFPTAVALSPDGQYLALLNNGRGTLESGYQQSIAIFDLRSGTVRDFPDRRLKVGAHQTYFLGLAFSPDGRDLYASMASETDPTGQRAGDTGNGIAVYSFAGGTVTPSRFLPIPPQPLTAGHAFAHFAAKLPAGTAIPYPAGLAAASVQGGVRLLVADNIADNAVLMDAESGKILQRFDLAAGRTVPSAYPYAVALSPDGATAWCSLWNASEVAQLDLETGRVLRRIPLLKPAQPTAAGSHPTALLLSPNGKRLYVALANADRVAVVNTATGAVSGYLSTELPGQRYRGAFPNALAQNADGSRLFVADASSDAVAVFDLGKLAQRPFDARHPQAAEGFIPTEWYPTALAVAGDHLLVASGKGEGVGPNGKLLQPEGRDSAKSTWQHPYIPSMIHGSVAEVTIPEAMQHLSALTAEVERSNLMNGRSGTIPFLKGGHPIRHVIYVIKENRTYDQVFGDMKEANGDPSLVMYGESITPNEHALARQFGILDNFYDSGEVSGNGHVWSTAAITSDYTEKTWQIGYRGSEHTYDYEGVVANGVPLNQDIPDVDEPGTGYLWGNAARHGLTHRNYGEFVETLWCNQEMHQHKFQEGTPLYGQACKQQWLLPGEKLPARLGDPRGSKNPWPWKVPVIARDVATKPELRGHFDPHFADFRLDYPDQFRMDEFANEFQGFVAARTSGRGTPLPQLVILRLPNDHTAFTRPGMPTPAASVADNDLAVGRLVDLVSHSPYWDDTAIFIVEDDAQDGADHVDAHRSIALVISKYAPRLNHPMVDHHFYTTVNMIHTIETLLGLPPMNNNDAQAAVMAPLFTGSGEQPAYQADRSNQKNGLLYKVNAPRARGAQASLQLDISHADDVNTGIANAILWHAAKGDAPMPKPQHHVILEEK